MEYILQTISAVTPKSNLGTQEIVRDTPSRGKPHLDFRYNGTREIVYDEK